MTNAIRLRLITSASAPAGSVKTKNGNEATVDIKEMNKGESLTRFIVQVAAVSCAATQVPEIKLANHMYRKTGFLRPIQVELFITTGHLPRSSLRRPRYQTFHQDLVLYHDLDQKSCIRPRSLYCRSVHSL
jgi:hypothetical protein